MDDKKNDLDPTALAGEVAPPVDSAFPTEPFACPVCGQMLAASCRVCVACHTPIDPAKIDTTQNRPDLAEELSRQRSEAGCSRATTVRFPWILFLAFFVILSLAEGSLEKRWGLVKTSMVFGALELISAIWVFFDAGNSRVTRRFRWAWGTLLLWPLVFPWYLARRKAPKAPCPFVEGMGLPIVLIIYLALTVLYVALKGPMV